MSKATGRGQGFNAAKKGSGQVGFQAAPPKPVSPAKTSAPINNDVHKTTAVPPSAVAGDTSGRDLRQEYLAYRRSLKEEENLKLQLRKMQEARPTPLLTAIKAFQALLSTRNPVAAYEIYKQHKKSTQQVYALQGEINRRKAMRESLCSDCEGSGVAKTNPQTIQCPTCGRVNSVYAARSLQPPKEQRKPTGSSQRKRPASPKS